MTAASTTSHTHWVACDVALQTRDLFGRVGLTPMEDGVLIHFSESLDLTQYPCCNACPRPSNVGLIVPALISLSRLRFLNRLFLGRSGAAVQVRGLVET